MRQVLAHGAGAGLAHPFMERWAKALATFGPVHAFEYDYMAAGKRRPDAMPKLLDAHRRALSAARAESDGAVVLVGKSMGSRVGCHLSVEESVEALVCFGYPLVATGSGKVRDEVLYALEVPILFIQGTRDKMCPLEHLEEVRRKMSVKSALHVVETGNHSLEITKTHTKLTGTTQDDVDAAMVAAVAAFYASSVRT